MDTKDIKCVVFDADNTLYSTKKVAKDADMEAMRVLQPSTEKTAEELYQEFLAIVKTVKDSADPEVRHRRYSYAKLCEKYGVDKVEAMYEILANEVIKNLEPIPEAVELLDALGSKLDLYVVTEDNREMAKRKLEKFGMADKLKRVVTSDDTGIMKPSIKYYGDILSKFEPKEILVLGDNYEKDLSLPEQLGMQVLLVDSPDKMEQLKKI